MANRRSFQKQIRNEGDRTRVLSTLSFQEDEFSMKWARLFGVAGAIGAFVGSNLLCGEKKSECCGIAGVVGAEDDDAR